jgi:hypothetical protein
MSATTRLPNGEVRFSCFFYGTLMHSAILARVIGKTGDHLTVRDGLLRV